MCKIIARPLRNEPDLLAGLERESLVITDLEENVMLRVEPQIDWTHELLEQMELVASSVASAFGHNTWNAYLGCQWIGSSEI